MSGEKTSMAVNTWHGYKHSEYAKIDEPLNPKRFSKVIDVDFVKTYFPHKQFLEKKQCLPIRLHDSHLDFSGRCVEIAVCNMQNTLGLFAVRQGFNNTELKHCPVLLRKADTDTFSMAIDYVYADGDEIEPDEDEELIPDETERFVLDLDVQVEQLTPIIFRLYGILKDAVRMHVSDIHFEARAGEASVRFRQDGVLQHYGSCIPLLAYGAMVNRLKIHAGKDIAETRLPQDGGFYLKYLGRRLDVRFSSLPTVHGEKIVLRFLDPRQAKLSLDTIIWDQRQHEEFKHALTAPHGIILVTGPTGSGKTTTLHNSLVYLLEVYGETRNITAVEDPVEYRLDGVNQVEARQSIGLTFERSLRSIVRQDPDILMIGEIRDAETANIAIQSSMTGHLVLSTVHTNDAFGVIPRLQDLGARPYLIAVTARLFQAQRLIRKLCPKCNTECLSEEELEIVLRNNELPTPIVERLHAISIRKAKPGGCAHCFNTGFHGRICVMEQITITEQIRDGITKNQSVAELTRMAVEQGFRPMIEYGMDLLEQGKTTVEEVLTLAKST